MYKVTNLLINNPKEIYEDPALTWVFDYDDTVYDVSNICLRITKPEDVQAFVAGELKTSHKVILDVDVKTIDLNALLAKRSVILKHDDVNRDFWKGYKQKALQVVVDYGVELNPVTGLRIMNNYTNTFGLATYNSSNLLETLQKIKNFDHPVNKSIWLNVDYDDDVIGIYNEFKRIG